MHCQNKDVKNQAEWNLNQAVIAYIYLFVSMYVSNICWL